ncbi:MAG TPA: hypothetical protein PK472_16980 [Pseudomonadota bacterium]|nr:hypothetical protein [Pseudomonadota bacterium]
MKALRTVFERCVTRRFSPLTLALSAVMLLPAPAFAKADRPAKAD